MNKVFVKDGRFELNSKSIGLLFFIAGVAMMFLPQTRGIGPFVIGIGMGFTLRQYVR